MAQLWLARGTWYWKGIMKTAVAWFRMRHLYECITHEYLGGGRVGNLQDAVFGVCLFVHVSRLLSLE